MQRDPREANRSREHVRRHVKFGLSCLLVSLGVSGSLSSVMRILSAYVHTCSLVQNVHVTIMISMLSGGKFLDSKIISCS